MFRTRATANGGQKSIVCAGRHGRGGGVETSKGTGIASPRGVLLSLKEIGGRAAARQGLTGGGCVEAAVSSRWRWRKGIRAALSQVHRHGPRADDACAAAGQSQESYPRTGIERRWPNQVGREGKQGCRLIRLNTRGCKGQVASCTRGTAAGVRDRARCLSRAMAKGAHRQRSAARRRGGGAALRARHRGHSREPAERRPRGVLNESAGKQQSGSKQEQRGDREADGQPKL